MRQLDRREFMGRTAAVVGTALAGKALGANKPFDTLSGSKRLLLSDTVTLANTGVKASRLAIGTGSLGGSEQRKLGISGLVKLFRYGVDQGVQWWDAADMYKTHPHVQATLREIPRDRVTITSKTRADTYDGVKADIERFRREMNSDYIDICLLHCMTDKDWPAKMTGPMDALSEAKEKGQVRAVGCSCHTFEALQAAADNPWVEVDLARINPYAEKMDVDRKEDVHKVVETLELMHQRGKAIYGMKILGEGAFTSEQMDESLRFALSKRFLAGFTIGVSSAEQIDDLARRVERLNVHG